MTIDVETIWGLNVAVHTRVVTYITFQKNGNIYGFFCYTLKVCLIV
jgi:hypothetical protein